MCLCQEQRKMDDDKQVKFPTFDGKDYEEWKYGMESFSDEKQSLDHVRSPLAEFLEPHEVMGEDEDAVRELKESDAADVLNTGLTCKRFIIKCVVKSQIPSIRSKETSHEIWMCLETIYEKKTPVTRRTLKKKLANLKFRPGGESFDDFRVIFDNLLLDSKIVIDATDDEWKVGHFLMTMPEENNNVVSALETLASENLTMEFCRLRISEEEAKRKSRKGIRVHRRNQGVLVAFKGTQDQHRGWSSNQPPRQPSHGHPQPGQVGRGQRRFPFPCNNC